MNINFYSYNICNHKKYELQKTNISNPSFGLIKLQAKELKQAKTLIEGLQSPEITESTKNSLIIKLYTLFEPHIEKEGELKAKATHILEEVISDLKIIFLELLDKSDKKINITTLINTIDKYEPNKDSVKQEWQRELSSDTPIKPGSTATFSDIIKEDDLPIPQSAEEIDEIKRTLNRTIESRTDLSSKTVKRLKARGQGKTYKEIAAEDGVSPDRATLSVHAGILKIQAKMGTIPKEDQERISDIAKVLGITFDKALKIISDNYILRYLYPETINKNVETSAKLLGIRREEFIKAALIKTSLLYLAPETINNNAETLAKLLNIKKEILIKAAIKDPHLFYQAPETINDNAETLARLLNIKKEVLIKAALNAPSIICQSPETIAQNVKKSVKLLGIKQEEFIKAALKQPRLFYQSPDTLNKNAETFAKLLNIEKQVLIKAALKNLSIVCQSPETMNKKVETSAKLFEISKEEFIQAALKQPQLFYQSPETLNQNIETLAKLLEIDKKELIQAALTQPSLFYQSPYNLNKNIEISAKNFKMSKKDFLKIALKNPVLFYRSPEALLRNSKLLNYYKQQQNKKTEISVTSCISSDKKICTDIFAYLMRSNGHSEYNREETINHLPEILNSLKDTTCLITIKNNEVAEYIMTFMKDYSTKILGKNIFEFKVTD